ncbi:MAG: 30S ribosomal protein S2 [Patescibacteria group bacterium]
MQNIAETQNKDEIVKEMFENGVQYGRAKRFTNSKLREFLIKSSKIVEIFDAVKTLEKIDELSIFLKKLLDEEKTILFVGIQPAAAKEMEAIAKSINQPYLVNKWVGGFLTNFSTIRMRVKFFEELKAKQDHGELDSYNPIEKRRVLRELQKMENIYDGVLNLTKVPALIFTANLNYKPHKTMLREAGILGIPVVGICGSDNNPDKFKMFIPANDKAPASIKWIMRYIINQINPEAAQNTKSIEELEEKEIQNVLDAVAESPIENTEENINITPLEQNDLAA